MAAAWNLAEADARRLEAREAQELGSAGLRSHWDDVRTELSFLEKSRRRKPGALRTQERYVRRDIPCGIEKCATCIRSEARAYAFKPKRLMKRDNTEYLVPDAFSLLQCMELLEEALFGDVVQYMLVLQTVLQEALRIAPSRDATRLKNFFREDRRMVADTCVYYFPDQHHADTCTEIERGGVYVDLDLDDSPEMEPQTVRNDRAILKTLVWYQRHHVSASSRLVFMTRDIDSPLSVQVVADIGCEVVTCESFLDQRFKRNGDFLRELAFNTAEAIVWWNEQRTAVDGNGNVVMNAEFVPHLPKSKLDELVAVGKLFKGKLEVSSHNPMESYVVLDGAKTTLQMDKVFVYGREDMNRGVHGDQVVVQLLPKEHWRMPQSDRLLVHFTPDENDNDAGKKTRGNDDEGGKGGCELETSSIRTIPTGYVVGVLQRSLRYHVATILSSTMNPNDDYGLAIPMDNRIPKVRIRSQRMDTLVDKRLKVVIDHWAVDSMYPSGHYVGVLGETGSLATELSALLVQNEIGDAPFSEAALACLPECDIEGNKIAECSTAKRPQFCELLDWRVPDEEVAVRRDLRSTHRVFSVDPPGCQDIDDAMSIRYLPNGNIELGVHIADVSYFVPHDSPLDFEARSRATTVYLVGMRLDMLPSVLSGDLCSLHQNVDRLAVSVMWELDGKTLNVIEDKTWFGRTIIRSCSSMTYEQAHRMLQGMNADGGKPNDRHQRSRSSDSSGDELPRGVAGGRIPLDLQKDLREDLVVLTDISRKLAQTRGDQGGLDLSKHEEVRFSLNVTELGKEGVEIIVKESLEIHSTIAELMIIANSYVAKRIVDVFPSNALLRRHPPPSGDRFTQLIKIAQAKDIVIDASNNYTLQQSLMAAEKSGNVDSKTMSLLKSLAVRVMSEAEYICASEADAWSDANDDTTSFAHYGLGLQYYTHFTSPIRRYADIIVHHQLLASLERGEKPQLLHKSNEYVPATAAPQAVPPSMTFSVLGDDDQDFLDDLISSVDSKLNVEALPMEQNSQHVQEGNEELLFPPHELVPLTRNLNKKNRNAKLAARDCDELFLALYFSSHTVKVQAVITSLKQNGFIVYVPKYDIRAPVYIRDKDGMVQMDPLLCGVRIVDTHPPTGVFANAGCIRMIPQAKIYYDADVERLEVSAPAADSSSDSCCVFKILDEVEVQISCDLSATSARVPQLQLLLVGRVKNNRKGPQRRETLMMKSKADTSLSELQRYVQKKNQLDREPSSMAIPSDSSPGVVKVDEEAGKRRDLYSVFTSPVGTISPVKKALKKKNTFSQKPTKESQPKKPSLVTKRGPGRLVFGEYEPAARQHFQQKLAHYMDLRSEELEEELIIHRRGQSSSMATQDLKRAEREAMSRAEKLASEKRHDKINRRNKAK
ncbi:Dis3-like exonuclease, partial [Globisporangium splendens]